MEKFNLYISYPGSGNESHSIHSEITPVIPRVGDLIDPFGFPEEFNADAMLRVTNVIHKFHHDNLSLSTQHIRIYTELTKFPNSK